MSANVDAMVREGINAYRAGKREEARALLFKAVELDEHNEQAWLWLSAVVDSVEDQQTCLENVLTINPHNERARQGLRTLSQRADGLLGVPPTTRAKTTGELPQLNLVEEDDNDPFANVSFTDPAPAPTATDSHATPFTAPIDDEELPTSVNWGSTETSSASTYRPVNEPSPEDYDDWVAGLNLNSGQSSTFITDEPEAPTSAEFSAQARNDLFGFDEPDLTTADADLEDDDDIFGGGPFDTSFEFDEPEPEPKAATPKAAPRMSPIEDTLDPLLSDIEADELDDFDLIEDYDDVELGSVDPSEYFKSIPVEITPTRLPGTNEGYPVLLILGLILLLALNAGAVVLLVNTLTA